MKKNQDKKTKKETHAYINKEKEREGAAICPNISVHILDITLDYVHTCKHTYCASEYIDID